MGDITLYVPDDLEARARAYGIPLSRSMRAILVAVLDVVQNRMLVPSVDPVAEVLEIMRTKGSPPEDHRRDRPSAQTDGDN